MVNYFELYDLPVSFNPDEAVVKAKFYELSKKYHPDRYTLSDTAEQAEMLQMSSVNNEAYKTLKSKDATVKYVLQLNELIENEEKYDLPPDFLMEMMDLNEVVSEYEMEAGNTELKDKAESLLNKQFNTLETEVAPLTSAYNNGDKSKELLLKIKDYYYRKKYLLRIQNRLRDIESE